MNPYRTLACAFLLLAAVCPWAGADEVLLKNGDRLTGKIDSDGDKLTIDTKLAGKVTVPLKNVKTFSTSAPGDLILTDGSKLHGKIEPGAEGQIVFTPEVGPISVIPFQRLRAVNPPPLKWVGNVLIGGLLARGNTDSDSLNAAADFSRRGEHDRIAFSGQYIFSRQRVPGDGKHETTNDLLGKAKYDYFFTPKLYAYAGIEAEHDPIAGLAIRLAPSVGAGYQWVETPRLSFNTEAGVGYLYRKYDHDGEDGTPDARLAYHLKVKFNEKVSAFHDLEYLPGFTRLDNYYFDTDAGIRANITDKFFTEFKVDYRYDSKPAPGKGPNDVRYILGVGWAF